MVFHGENKWSNLLVRIIKVDDFFILSKRDDGNGESCKLYSPIVTSPCLLLGHNNNYFHPYFAIIVPPFVFSMSFRACLHGVGDPGLVGLVSFVFTLWGTQNKETYPTRPGSPTPYKQGLIPSFNVLSGCLFSLNFIVVATLWILINYVSQLL